MIRQLFSRSLTVVPSLLAALAFARALFAPLRRTSLALALSLALSLVPALAHAGPNDGLPKSAQTLDRTTPRRAFDGFLAAAHAGDYLLAAHYLDLRAIPRNTQTAQGSELAEKLAYVLERKMPLDSTTIVDDPEGKPNASNGSLVVGHVLIDEEAVPITLTRVRFDDGTQRWVIARSTVAMVPAFYAAYGAPRWEDKVPLALRARHVLGVAVWQWLALGAVIVGAFLVGWIVAGIATLILRPLARRTVAPWDDRVVERGRRPGMVLVAAIAIELSIRPLHMVPTVEEISHRLAYTLMVVGISWLALATLAVLADFLHARVPKTDDPEELKGRGLRTQLFVAQRIVSVVVWIVAAAVLLMQFEVVRSIGLSLLASAGVAGVVIGFAAQRSLAGVIAGIHLSITQPIRLGDTVIVEGEYGVIEEINLTYVVVRVWDERRLIVPIAQFLEKPFQNWTKVDPALHGIVLLQVDYSTPVEELRVELARIAAESPKWDGRTASIVVFDASDRTMTLRITVSSRNASDNFDLRCEVREKLIAFLQAKGDGKFLPVTRSAILSAPKPS